MPTSPGPVEMDQAVARDWSGWSLGQVGVGMIGPAVRGVVEERDGHAYALVPEGVDPVLLARPREGGIVGTRAARTALASVLAGLVKVVVRRRGRGCGGPQA
jgi:hypothetical protein